MEELIYLVYLNLNHDDPLAAYEALENFIDTHTRIYLYVTGTNRALLVWSTAERPRLERDLLKFCVSGPDHVTVREIGAAEQLPKHGDLMALAGWLSQRTDWWQWRNNFPDSTDLPTTVTLLPPPATEPVALLPAPPRSRRLSMERMAW